MINKPTYEELEKVIRELELHVDFFQLIADNTVDWEIYRDPTGKILYCNKAFERITGYSVDELLTGKISEKDFVHTDDWDMISEQMQNTIKNVIPETDIEFRILTKNKEIKILNLCSQPVFHLNQFLGFRTSIRDITDYKILQALKESETKYKTLFESMHDVFFVCEIIKDIEGNAIDFRYLDANLVCLKKAKCNRDEMIGRTYLELFPPNPIFKNWCKYFAEVVQTGKPVSFEQFAEETGYYFEVNAFSHEQGKCAVIMTDITERKTLENKNYIQSLQLEHIHNGVITIDFNNTILSWNKYAETLYQWTSEEAIGKNIIELLTPEELQSVVRSNFDNLYEKGHWEGDFEVKRKDKTKIQVDIITTHLKDINGNNIGFVGVSNDITERIKAELVIQKQNEELKKLNETKDKFLHIIAHDLRNPFASIMGLSGLMETDMVEDNKIDLEFLRYTQMINTTSKHALDLVENLMRWARSQRGEIKVNLEKISIKSLISNVTSLIDGNLLKKNISIEEDLENDDLVYADADMANTILRNLLTNAIKFTHESGKVILSTQKRDGFLEISITDTGIGIHPKDLEKIFRIDSKFSSLGTNNERGTGLGLILCKEFVEKQGGGIWVESELGKGSKFTFSLPLGR